MGYNRFVQIGRVARVNYGPLEGKVATIVDILNDKRVLIDGEGFNRQVIPITRLQLTKQVLSVGRGIRTGKLRATLTKQNVQKTFDESPLGASYARQARRQQLTDFERFKVLNLRRRLSKLLRARQDKKKNWFMKYFLFFIFNIFFSMIIPHKLSSKTVNRIDYVRMWIRIAKIIQYKHFSWILIHYWIFFIYHFENKHRMLFAMSAKSIVVEIKDINKNGDSQSR